MTAFADSSAVVKLYADEEGSELVRSWPGPAFTAMITSVEVAGALWRKCRMDELAANQARLLAESARHDLETSTGPLGLLSIALIPAILDQASALVTRHPLRACDAVQLATALHVRSVAPVRDFLSFDRQLCVAAAREGFDVPFEPSPVSP